MGCPDHPLYYPLQNLQCFPNLLLPVSKAGRMVKLNLVGV